MNSTLLLFTGISFFMGLIIGLMIGKKKQSNHISDQNTHNNLNDPVSIAKSRFAQGEISKSQLDEIIEVLSIT